MIVKDVKVFLDPHLKDEKNCKLLVISYPNTSQNIHKCAERKLWTVDTFKPMQEGSA